MSKNNFGKIIRNKLDREKKVECKKCHLKMSEKIIDYHTEKCNAKEELKSGLLNYKIKKSNKNSFGSRHQICAFCGEIIAKNIL